MGEEKWEDTRNPSKEVRGIVAWPVLVFVPSGLEGKRGACKQS